MAVPLGRLKPLPDSALVSSAGCGVSPQQSLLSLPPSLAAWFKSLSMRHGPEGKSSPCRDDIASTRDERATQASPITNRMCDSKTQKARPWPRLS
jgi:hypothetical protein